MDLPEPLAPPRHGPHASSPPQDDEIVTYSLCLLGSLRHFAASATGGRIKEIPLQLDSTVRQVSCGLDWLCLLTDAGRVYSFGSNTYGQLAQGHTHAVPHPKPILFAIDKRIAKLSCGSSHGGFLLDTGALFMFGCGSYGRLGTGNETAQTTPVAVKMRWRDLEVKATELTREPRTTIPGSVVVAAAGTPSTTSDVPVDADEEVVFVDVSCGDRHTLVLGAKTSVPTGGNKKLQKNHIIAFGDGMNGRLGLGSERDSATGMLLTQFRSSSLSKSIVPTFASIHAGASHSAAVSTTGEVFTWGNGAEGQLGHGSCESEWVPREVQFFRGHAMASVQCGAKHTVAVSRTGMVYAWGRGLEGQLGAGAIVTNATQPQRVTLTADPLAAQHAQLEAQLTAGTSFSTTVSSLIAPDARVVTRAIVVKDNMAMALDEQARLFVWGDNTAGQLGLLPPMDRITTPHQLAYMDLREPKRLSSRVRDRVLGGTITNLPRVGLVHVDASDRFSVLVFRTKLPVLGQGSLDDDSMSSSVGNVTRHLLRQRSTIVHSLDDKVRWQFSLTEPLQLKDIPSREAAFYDYMVRYQVRIRTSEPTKLHSEEERNEGDAHDPEHRRASHIPGGYHSKRRSSVAAMPPDERAHLQAHFRCEDQEEDCSLMRRSPTRSTAEAVRGYEAWLTRQLSPTKSPGCFGTARRFPIASPKEPTNQKEDQLLTPVRPQSSAATPRRPRPPKSAFGRAVIPSSPRASIVMGSSGLPRRPTTAVSDSSHLRSITPHDSSPSSSKDTQQRLYNQFTAPFGSSVASRFGVKSPRANDSVQLDIHPEQSHSAVLPRSPGAILGSNAEHFSEIIARRLSEANGPGPGPGTYDRKGG